MIARASPAQRPSSALMPAVGLPVPVLIGTSGWVYRHWRDMFYPHGLPASSQLSFFAQRFPTVEVNYSFYHLPERSVFENWKRQTPDGFLFAVKASRYLTHLTKLKNPDEPLQRLMERASALETKLGPILFQFPASWSLDLARLADFLRALRPYAPQRFTFEFRHSSWLCAAVYDLLEASEAALCLPVGPRVPLDPRLTTSWSYIRMHSGGGSIGYADDELDLWAGRIRGFLEQGAECYVYFNNDAGGHAIRDAERLARRLAD